MREISRRTTRRKTLAWRTCFAWVAPTSRIAPPSPVYRKNRPEPFKSLMARKCCFVCQNRRLRCVDDLQSASRCRRNACCLAGLDLASLPGSGRADRAVARRQGTNVFPTAKKARPHFEKPGEVSLGGATLLRIVPTVGKGELPPAHLRRAFAANSKYDKIVMPSSHTLGVAYVRLSEVAISFHDRTM